jgi:hypothetical protein
MPELPVTTKKGDSSPEVKMKTRFSLFRIFQLLCTAEDDITVDCTVSYCVGSQRTLMEDAIGRLFG